MAEKCVSCSNTSEWTRAAATLSAAALGCSKQSADGWFARSAALSEEEGAAASGTSPPTLVNVGSNKGYKIVQYLNLFAASAGRAHRATPTPKRWHHLIKLYAKQHGLGHLGWSSCGSCQECAVRPFGPRDRLANSRERTSGRLTRTSLERSLPPPPPPVSSLVGAIAHAIELSNATRHLLRFLVRATNLSDAIFVHDFGASNATGRVGVQRNFVGFESNAASYRPIPIRNHTAAALNQPRWRPGPSERVVALDDFAAASGLHRIHMLLVDAEGWDALVVEGARGLLTERRVDILQFEYGGKVRLNMAYPTPCAHAVLAAAAGRLISLVYYCSLALRLALLEAATLAFH